MNDQLQKQMGINGFDFQKAKQALDSLSFEKRLKAMGSLLKHTFTIVGKDEDILKPWIRMAIYHTVMVSCFFYAVMSNWYDLPWAPLAGFLTFILFLYKHFYNNRQELRMSWTVYETVIGNDPSYKGSVQHWKQLKSQTRKLAWLDIVMASMRKFKNQTGFIGAIINMIVSGLQEVWDLANHYLLPSVAIDQLDITPGIKKMKKLKDEVPETLMGVFGLDILGSIVKRTVIPVYIVLIIVSGLIGYFGTDYFPTTTLFDEGNIPFTWVPLVFSIYVGKLFSNLFERTVTGIKVIYFTIFYTKITHPDRIAPELQDELLGYLKLDGVDEVDNLDEQGAVEEAGEPAIEPAGA
ncbi:MAG: hypothetical protein ACQETE_06545 [Bacteroidota bacterium]